MKVHVTDNPKLYNSRASNCESNTADFYTKALAIFDTQANFEASGTIQVGTWNKINSSLCLDEDSRHIWVHLDTVNKLYPDNSNPNSDGSELGLSLLG